MKLGVVVGLSDFLSSSVRSIINAHFSLFQFSSSGSCSPAPAPLVSMDSEFDIMSGHETPDTLDHDRLPVSEC